MEVIDRLQYTGKSILNFAKKKLGMEVETGDEPQRVGDIPKKLITTVACLDYLKEGNCSKKETKIFTASFYMLHILSKNV